MLRWTIRPKGEKMRSSMSSLMFRERLMTYRLVSLMDCPPGRAYETCGRVATNTKKRVIHGHTKGMQTNPPLIACCAHRSRSASGWRPPSPTPFCSPRSRSRNYIRSAPWAFMEEEIGGRGEAWVSIQIRVYATCDRDGTCDVQFTQAW